MALPELYAIINNRKVLNLGITGRARGLNSYP